MTRPDLDALAARAKRARMGGEGHGWDNRPACLVPVDDVLWLVERVRELEEAAVKAQYLDRGEVDIEVAFEHLNIPGWMPWPGDPK